MRDLLSIGTSRGCEMIGTGIGLGLAGYRFNPAGVLPVLDINFRDFKTFSSAIGPTASFSRASSGTYFDETGVLRTASTNVGRINHVYNGTSWVCKGGLIEDQRTNVLPNSQQFDNAAWNKSGAVAITADQLNAPDETLTGDLLKPTAGNSTHYLFRQSLSYSSGNNTLSIFAKYQNHRWFVIQYYDGAKSVEASFDLLNGLAGAVGSGASSAMSNAGNGWYRLSITSSAASGSGSGYFTIALNSSDSASIQAWNATGSESVAIWGAQLEAGALSSYIATTSASATRSADVMQITGSNFSGFWNQSEGTFATECDANGFNASGVNYMGVASTGGLSQYAFVGRFQGSLSSLNYQVYNGSPDCSITLTPAGSNPTKSAFGFKANDCAASANAGAVSTDTTVAMTTALTQLEIGNFLGNNFLNGHIARLRYWNTRLDNATLRALST